MSEHRSLAKSLFNDLQPAFGWFTHFWGDFCLQARTKGLDEVWVLSKIKEWFSILKTCKNVLNGLLEMHWKSLQDMSFIEFVSLPFPHLSLSRSLFPLFLSYHSLLHLLPWSLLIWGHSWRRQTPMLTAAVFFGCYGLGRTISSFPC